MNKQLLEHYIEAYGTDIYSFCIRLTQNREQAEELYQDTFLAMCEKEDWKEEGNVKSYLLGITIKLWQNRKRKRRSCLHRHRCQSCWAQTPQQKR